MSGWFYLWGIAKINGCEWKPQDSVQKKWLKTLTADCAVQEGYDPHLRNEGHVQDFYVEEMGVKHTDALGQKMKLSKKAEVQSTSEFGEPARVRRQNWLCCLFHHFSHLTWPRRMGGAPLPLSLAQLDTVGLAQARW